MKFAISEFQTLSLSKRDQKQSLSRQNEFICMRMKNHSHINSFKIGLTLGQLRSGLLCLKT